MSRIRPFLSHRRTNAGRVIELRDELRLRGAGGWRDLDDLLVGTPSSPQFVDVIQRQTAGFIWYATPQILESDVVNTIELPTALDRLRTDSRYRLHPAFASIGPSAVRRALDSLIGDPTRAHRHKLSDENVETLLDQNGDVRGGNSYATFHTDVAKRYLGSALPALGLTDYTVAFASLLEPNGAADLTFDWRGLIDPDTRLLADGAQAQITDALRGALDVILQTTRRPVITITGELPLPLATLVGYHWRVTTGATLNIEQRFAALGQHRSVIHGGGPVTTVDIPWTETAPGDGPDAVVGFSIGHDRTAHMEGYARQANAARFSVIHIGRFDLDAREIRGVARHVAAKLVAESSRPLHLLVAAPFSIAVLIGTGMNGLTAVMPAWTPAGYTPPIQIR